MDLTNLQLRDILRIYRPPTRGWKEIQRHCPRRIGWRCRLGGGSSPSRGSRPSCDSLLCSSLSFLSSFLSLSFLSLFFSSISKSEKFNLSAEWIIHGYTFSPLRSSSNTFSALHVVDRNRSRGGNAPVLRMPEHFLEWPKIFQIRSRWSHLTKKAKTFVIASLVHVYVSQILWFSCAQIFEHLSRLIHRRN